ncbi:flavin reductase family protein [Ruegeria arenilitoris]|uniref:flavin reductase family protein n=1 Tax=Ruegeria arenilitoris TaxID=1173585 RepID=UPI00147A1147|nr:flavin reductase family protein [Ruegeria arenilitoris]
MTVSRDMFISAMRQVASSVTIVTTDGSAGRAGATVSAFTSLSADPPSVLVCLRSDSRIARTVAANGAFSVNVLPEDASHLAQKFSGMFDHAQRDPFQGIEMSEAPSGAVLAGATSFNCTVEQTMTHGTHSVVVGSVSTVSEAGMRPLAYMAGAYHVVRPQNDPTGEPQCQ